MFCGIKTLGPQIELKDTFTPKSFKVYNLTPQEQIELDKFFWTKATFDHHNHQWDHHFSLLTRRMENSHLVKIIDTLINI